MEVLKKILNIVIDIFIVLVVIVSATIAVISVTARDSGVSNLFGYVPFTVQSNSMSPVFEAGDMIVGKHLSDEDKETMEFKKGDIITFWDSMEDENGQNISFLNTHRIVKAQTLTEAPAGQRKLETKGDHNVSQDDGYITDANIVAIWSQEGKDDGIRIQKIGSVLDFLRKPSGFFMAVLLPMAIFFIYELIRFITNLSNYNKEKAKEAALEAAKELMGDSASDSSGLSEEQKAQAILEFLEKQKAQQEGENAPKAEETEQPATDEETVAVPEPEQEEEVSEASED